MRTLRIVALAVLLGALVLLVACSGQQGTRGTTGTTSSTGGMSGGKTIVLKNLAFNPATLKVNAGDKVVFKNEDTAPHHVVVGNDDLGLQPINTDKTWTAPSDGIYLMKCLIHPTMRGRIMVGNGGGSMIGTVPAGTGMRGGAGTGTGMGSGAGTGTGGATGGY